MKYLTLIVILFFLKNNFGQENNIDSLRLTNIIDSLRQKVKELDLDPDLNYLLVEGPSNIFVPDSILANKNKGELWVNLIHDEYFNVIDFIIESVTLYDDTGKGDIIYLKVSASPIRKNEYPINVGKFYDFVKPYALKQKLKKPEHLKEYIQLYWPRKTYYILKRSSQQDCNNEE